MYFLKHFNLNTHSSFYIEYDDTWGSPISQNTLTHLEVRFKSAYNNVENKELILL